ncbi:MAG: glycoside hydrolase family 78 protein [Clostridiales bacterium]|jgi:alpha-L-rhamnosidase|nr:glycoside hydrolase family 78 protein [Clostridiales bacterium]
MAFTAKWIRSGIDTGGACPAFAKAFRAGGKLAKATLLITATGAYEAAINGRRVGDYVLAPGWTVYSKRLQYQSYDVTGLLGEQNELEVTVGDLWYRFPSSEWQKNGKDGGWPAPAPAGVYARIELRYADGSREAIVSGASWVSRESPVRSSQLYDGEVYDATFAGGAEAAAVEFDPPGFALVRQQGEIIKEHERLSPAAIFRTPAGETVVDFGQNLTGYTEFAVSAKAGDRISVSHAEILDRDGNFYTENYRAAKARIEYTCKDGRQTYKPKLTFFGFRYIRLDEFPGEPSPDCFTAIAVHSDIRRTGFLSCSEPMLNRLFSNIVWGQKGNFLDVPTDCPQRDERLGWTGDAQAFAKAASYNFDVERFFAKWLQDLAIDQRLAGFVPHVVPNVLQKASLPNALEKGGASSAAWGDAAVICPWQMYLAYGGRELLSRQYPSMRRWVDYVGSITKKESLWTGGEHFGDWLGLDSPPGSYKGASREDFIASAYYAHSTALLIKAGRALGKDVSKYESLLGRIARAFQKEFPEYLTQTEHVLAIHFGLAPDPQKAADDLAAMIERDGSQLRTGFAGTPYILHALSRYGHSRLAYTLLLRKEYPGWLYPVSKGATTIWEHWDGIMPDGGLWSRDMNSFNHYAYGCVADWVYEVAAGITPVEEAPGFAKLRVEPHPDERLGWLEAVVETRHGRARSRWEHVEGRVRYEIDVPSPAVISIGGAERAVPPGSYVF